MGFVVDPNKVFGDSSTVSAHATARLLNLSLAEISAHESNWLSQVKFDYGLDKQNLRSRDLRPGQTYILVYESGKLDRFQVVANGKLKFFLKPDAEMVFNFPDVLAVNSGVYFEEYNLRKKSQVRFPKSKVKRIVWIYN